MLLEKPKNENRTIEQITEHYNIEKDLANSLRFSKKEERQTLYADLYDKLFQQVPHHPQVTRKIDSQASAVELTQKLRLLSNYLYPNATFLEIGPGDCHLAFAVAKKVKKVYAVDVSQEIAKNSSPPDNFELIISDGCDIPLPENSIDIAYSNQLMEHLHPDDALEQLRNIYKTLTPQGVYICITPNKLSGPHDISKYFDEVATGFHLREYTNTELKNIFSLVGFSQVTSYIGGKGVYVKFPFLIIYFLEKILGILPSFLRRKVTQTLLVKALLGVIIVGRK